MDPFLRCLSGAYLCAFVSLYVQIPGLYGNTGILPVRIVLLHEPSSVDEWHHSPTILRFKQRLGLDAETALDLCCLVGIVVSFASLVWMNFRNSIVYFVLWFMYLSLFQVGQTFLWFQWDTLLLEVGFLAVIAAPLSLLPVSRWKWFHQHDSITLWLVKWLLFRLMFASGVVKLTSGCPTWWGLTALNYHYETQCIPTPLAWYAHQLPAWFQSLSVVGTFVIEIIVPFLFFAPSRRYVAFAASAQVFLMIVIILSGNYNFFNWLTITLCMPFLVNNNSSCIWNFQYKSESSGRNRFIRKLFNLIVYGTLLYITVHYFSLSINFDQRRVDSAIAFTMSDLQEFLNQAVPFSIFIGIISLSLEICSAIVRCVVFEKNMLCKLTNMFGCIVFGLIAVIMFLISLVPYSTLHQPTHDGLPQTAARWHSVVNNYHLTNSYGLFRRMTGVDGRPEVIIQGSNSMQENDWIEYEFLYKPGNVSRPLPFVAPHQPRLDWQMWFAALGSYNHNPWFLNLMYRLLTNEKQVLELMAENPFPKSPPRYVRALLYHYHFTNIDQGCKNKEGENLKAVSNSTWWCRKLVGDYFPIISSTEPSFVEYLKRAGIYEESSRFSESKSSYNELAKSVKLVRALVGGQPDGFISCLSFLSAAFVLIFLKRLKQ